MRAAKTRIGLCQNGRTFRRSIWGGSSKESCARISSFHRPEEAADDLVIQTPLAPETRHLFNRGTLRRVKLTAILTNTARGPIVEDAAIHEALAEGWIAGAALDDIEEEPAKQHDCRPAKPLFQLHNVINTPHAAYYSEEAIGTVRRIEAEEAVRVLSGLPALSPVNTIAA